MRTMTTAGVDAKAGVSYVTKYGPISTPPSRENLQIDAIMPSGLVSESHSQTHREQSNPSLVWSTTPSHRSSQSDLVDARTFRSAIAADDVNKENLWWPTAKASSCLSRAVSGPQVWTHGGKAVYRLIGQNRRPLYGLAAQRCLLS